VDKKQDVLFPAYASVIVVFISAAYVLLRYPFEMDCTSLLKLMGLSFFLINAPFVVYLNLKKRGLVDFYSVNIQCVFLLLLIVLVAGFLGMSFLSYVVVLSGFVAISVTLYELIRTKPGGFFMPVVLLFIFSLWLVGESWEGRMLTPLFFEKLIGGLYNNPADLNSGLDTMFHMSFAQMLKTYNVPSTGLDEIPLIPYHYGSHFLLAHLSKVLDVSILSLYHIGFPIIFLPLFFYVLFLIFHQCLQSGVSKRHFNILFWLLLFVLFIGFLPNDPTGYAFRTGLAWNSIIKSESYLISLTFFFIFLSIFLLPLANAGSLNITMSRFVILILILIAIGFCKISTLFILDVILGYTYLRYQLYKSGMANLLVGLALLVSIVMAYFLHDTKAPGSSFEFLHFYKNFIFSRFHFFIALYFLWSFVLVGICILLYIRKIRFNPILLELQLVIAIVGFLPGMLLRVEGGSAHYFSDIQHWMAFISIGYYAPLLYSKPVNRKIKMAGYATGCLLLALASANAFFSFERTIKDNYITKQTVLGRAARNIDAVTSAEILENRETFFTRRLQTVLEGNNDYHKLMTFSALDQLADKEARILYIEDDQWLTQYLPCYKSAFFATAVTGIALLDGFSLDDCFWGGYSVEYYKGNKATSTPNYCDRVQNDMFEEVVSYNFEKQSYRIIDCGLQNPE
jgi:hypothetical protein